MTIAEQTKLTENVEIFSEGSDAELVGNVHHHSYHLQVRTEIFLSFLFTRSLLINCLEDIIIQLFFNSKLYLYSIYTCYAFNPF